MRLSAPSTALPKAVPAQTRALTSEAPAEAASEPCSPEVADLASCSGTAAVSSPRSAMLSARTTGWRAALVAVPLLGPCLAVFLEASPADPHLRSLLDGMADAPLNGSQGRVLLQAARRLGPLAMERLAAGGIRVHLGSSLDEQGGLSAVYNPTRKTVTIGFQRLTVDTAVHELGHALDDLAAADTPDGPVLRSEGDARLQKLYEAYHQRHEEAPGWQRSLERGPVWSDYADTSAQEYLAEGIMVASRNIRSESRLQKQDPELLGYIRDLLTEG